MHTWAKPFLMKMNSKWTKIFIKMLFVLFFKKYVCPYIGDKLCWCYVFTVWLLSVSFKKCINVIINANVCVHDVVVHTCSGVNICSKMFSGCLSGKKCARTSSVCVCVCVSVCVHFSICILLSSLVVCLCFKFVRSYGRASKVFSVPLSLCLSLAGFLWIDDHVV